MGIVWQTPPSALIANVEAYGQRVQRAVAAVGQLLAPKIEAYAKANGPWTDRTGQARQGLTAISEASVDLVTVYLYHGAEHGKWLEIANGGRYRVIIPALSAHYGEAMSLIRSVIGGG
jgi:hypothetical protein